MVLIRKANLKDAPFIVELYKEYNEEHDSERIKETPQLKPYLELKENAQEIIKKNVLKDIVSVKSAFFIAELNGSFVGFIEVGVGSFPNEYKIEKAGHIYVLFVKKENRSKSISSKLKVAAYKWIKQKGINYVRINVVGNNIKAHQIYKKWGFIDYLALKIRKIH